MAIARRILLLFVVLSLIGFFAGLRLAWMDDPAWVNPLANYMMAPGIVVIGLGLGALIGSSDSTDRLYMY